jgi:uncharacterized DUF497 family protein
MEFEWDEGKRLANMAKHGLDFVDAPVLFDGGLSRHGREDAHWRAKVACNGDFG